MCRCLTASLAVLLAGSAWAQAAPPGAAASAAMDRARRIADNPMRVILEAGKAPRKAIEAEPAAGADAAGVRRAPAKTEATLSAGRLGAAPAIAMVPALEADTAAAPAIPLPQTTALRVEPAAEPVRPKLVTMVEPQVPQRVLQEIRGTVEVLADLTIRPDGTVSQVVLVPPAHRLLQRYVEAALEQWRFEPLAAQRVHRVQLVFSDR
ncbi:MAG: hypothetical protein Q8K96_04270 [Rubrivivax sp.]|nr:hypothetical protein [Rubrivivax sp.]